MADSERLRGGLLEQFEQSGCLTSPAIKRAFLAVPRECFLREIAEREGLERVYRDQAIVTRHDARGSPASSSSQPSLMASMLEQLDLVPGHRVLEIGAGTGYNAALLAEIVGDDGKVVSIELDPATARDARRALTHLKSAATVVCGDGREGHPQDGPYDRIIVTASSPVVPRAWHHQLREGGLLELPLLLARSGTQIIATLRRDGPRLRSVALLHGGFMALRDAPGAAVAPPAPSMGAVEQLDGRSRSLAHLSGRGLRSLSQTRRQQLLALALSEPRRRPLGLRASRAAIGLYLRIEAPPGRLIGGWPGIGIMSANGDGLALLAGGRKMFTHIDAYGNRGAERVLVDLVEAWKTRGRPSIERLRIHVSFMPTDRSAVRLNWTT